MRGDFVKAYWQYRNDGGKLSMKEYAELMRGDKDGKSVHSE